MCNWSKFLYKFCILTLYNSANSTSFWYILEDIYKDATSFFASMKAYVAAGAQKWAATSFFENGLLPTSGTAASDLYKYLD